jgi:hypothetical protein
MANDRNYHVVVNTLNNGGSFGNGKNTLFWTDRWLFGQSLEQSLPHLFGSVAARARRRTVYDTQ